MFFWLPGHFDQQQFKLQKILPPSHGFKISKSSITVYFSFHEVEVFWSSSSADPCPWAMFSNQYLKKKVFACFYKKKARLFSWNLSWDRWDDKHGFYLRRTVVFSELFEDVHQCPWLKFRKPFWITVAFAAFYRKIKIFFILTALILKSRSKTKVSKLMRHPVYSGSKI